MEVIKIDPGEPVRIYEGIQTGHRYLVVGEGEFDMECRGTVVDESPAFKRGDKVWVSPHAVHGYLGVAGTVVEVYVGLYTGQGHVYSVRLDHLGAYELVGEIYLQPHDAVMWAPECPECKFAMVKVYKQDDDGWHAYWACECEVPRPIIKRVEEEDRERGTDRENVEGHL